MGIGWRKTKRQLWRLKSGLDAPDPGNYHTRRGHALELFALGEFEREEGIGFTRVPWVLQHPEYEWMTCNLDALTADQGVGECKAPGDYVQGDLKRLRERLPVNPMSAVGNYVIQCQHNMIVTGLRHAWLIVLPGTDDPVFVRIEWNEELAQAIIAAERSFWFDNVKANVEPPARADDLRDLAREWRRLHEGELETGDGELVSMFGQLRSFMEAAEDARAIASAHELMATNIKASIVERARFYGADKLRVLCSEKRGSVTHVRPKPKLNRAALEAAHPEVVKEFLEPSNPYFKVTP
jgi:hypothetical protein